MLTPTGVVEVEELGHGDPSAAHAHHHVTVQEANQTQLLILAKLFNDSKY